MSAKRSTNSIERPEGYSGGLSRSAYTTPWDLSPWNETSPSPAPIVACWAHDTGAGLVDHVVHFELDETIAEPDQLLFPLQRMFCHFLVDQVPDVALREVIEWLANTYDFYQGHSLSPPLLSAPQNARARVVGRYNRPVFQVTED